jgi:hypothetical protein
VDELLVATPTEMATIATTPSAPAYTPLRRVEPGAPMMCTGLPAGAACAVTRAGGTPMKDPLARFIPFATIVKLVSLDEGKGLRVSGFEF